MIVSQGRRAVPSLILDEDVEFGVIGLPDGIGTSASRRWTRSKESLYAFEPSWASVSRAGSSLPITAWTTL